MSGMSKAIDNLILFRSFWSKARKTRVGADLIVNVGLELPDRAMTYYYSDYGTLCSMDMDQSPIAYIAYNQEWYNRSITEIVKTNNTFLFDKVMGTLALESAASLDREEHFGSYTTPRYAAILLHILTNS